MEMLLFFLFNIPSLWEKMELLWTFQTLLPSPVHGSKERGTVFLLFLSCLPSFSQVSSNHNKNPDCTRKGSHFYQHRSLHSVPEHLTCPCKHPCYLECKFEGATYKEPQTGSLRVRGTPLIALLLINT